MDSSLILLCRQAQDTGRIQCICNIYAVPDGTEYPTSNESATEIESLTGFLVTSMWLRPCLPAGRCDECCFLEV